METGTEEGGGPKLAAVPPVCSMANNTVSPEVLYAERIHDGYSTHTLSTGRICIDTDHILTSPSH